MQCITHISVANALSLVSLRPTSIGGLISTVVGASLGGGIPDYDANKDKKADYFLVGSGLLLIIAFIMGYILNIKCLIIDDKPLYTVITGIILILITCLYGRRMGHRTFLHSICGLAIFSLIFYFCLTPLFISFVIGMVSHILLDITTIKQVKVFYPSNYGISLKKSVYNGKLNKILLLLSIIINIIYIIVFIW